MAEHETKSIHLLQRLMDRINCEYEDLSYSKCANYLVDNYNRLQDISLQELCDKNFVSKSTVRRFCQNMGYQNFSELKLSKATEEKTAKEEMGILEYLKRQVDVSEIDIGKILGYLDDYSSVYILFPNELYFAAYEFQRQMSELNRIVYLVPNIDLHFSLIEKLLDTSLVIILNIDEQYTNSLEDYIKDIKGKICRISLSKNENGGDIVIGSREQSVDPKYLYLYFLDMIFKLFENRERFSFP
ncbi:MAG: MurR/RpiR family transcriptional regulator [Oscillospiraceae bacterium]|nr:MurR/RpiR family transcriptional regulator [Oscillospiraceae bacterium]